ncbi:MAG: hypothetical protein RL659_848 [Pseudomonadota bacterium]|jgi:hypothetical protein
MKRLNLAAKAFHVGLSPEQNELEISSKICKYLDEAVAEMPVNVMNRLEQIRFKSVAARRNPTFSKSILDQSGR